MKLGAKTVQKTLAWDAILMAALLSCHGGQEGTDTSASTTQDLTSTGSPTSTDGPTTTGGEPGICANSAPVAGGPCAPFGVIMAGNQHTCTLLFGGKIRCWGENGVGQLGLGHVNPVGDDEPPGASPPLDLGEAAIQIAAGRYHTCAVTESGRVYCWGSGKFGRLGYANTMYIGDDELAGSAGPVPLEGTAVQIAAGHEHTCALMSDGSVYCWGGGQYGHLGTGNTSDIGDDETAATLGPVDLGGPAVQLSASDDHTCAVLNDGGVICWGRGDYGQLGQGNTENIGDDETPGTVGLIEVGAAAVSVATGAFHTCALTVAGEVRCWGSHGNGKLGYGNIEDIGDDENPSEAGAVSVGGAVVAVAAHGASTCALLDDATLKCWGLGSDGQLGYGDTNDIGSMNAPSDFGAIEAGGPVAQVAVGWYHVCALLVDDSIRCWGNGTEGALGYGNTGTWDTEGSLCLVQEPGSVCDIDPLCCIGDMPGEMPPPPVQYQ
jgi:alpha-tubulin suppressor-like RCC1 family protein